MGPHALMLSHVSNIQLITQFANCVLQIEKIKGMTLHVIHLSRRRDRLDTLQEELLAQGVEEYRIWEGLEDPLYPYRGISKAHKQVVGFAREQKYPKILIGEDDLKFTAPGALAYFLKKEPPVYDLYLGGISYGSINDDQTVNDFSGTHLYMIRESFYQTFLSLPETGDIDRKLKGLGRYIVCNPFVALQHNGFSDNTKRFMDYGPYFSGRSLLVAIP
jgi:hypothetical protein